MSGCAATRVQLHGTQHFALTSAHTGRTYEIELSVPDEPPPADGYGVVYVLDGNASLPVADKTARAIVQLAHGNKLPVTQTLIVAIGYPGTVLLNEQARADDYTPPAPDVTQTGDARNKRQGGGDRFLEFLERELKPAIAARFPIDTTRETLMGHSYGGLFALHVLFTRPDAFDTYIAGSPSIWWNQRWVLTERDAFLASGRASTAKLLLTVGGLEQTVPPRLAARARLLESRRMIDNAKDVATSLEGRVDVRLRIFVGDDHYGAVLPMLRTGLITVMAPALLYD